MKDQSFSSDQSLRSQQQQTTQQQEEQRKFRNIYLKQKSQNQLKDKKYEQYIQKPIELMFIIFSVYKDHLETQANKYNCKIKIAMDRILIFSDTNQQDVKKCTKAIIQETNKINHIQLKLEGKYQFYQSPYFVQKSRDLKFYMTKFNGKIFCHSNQLDNYKLKAKSKQLFLGKKIFPICFKSYKQNKQLQIHTHLRAFIRKLIRHYESNEFRDRNVIVQVDRQQNKVNCLGQKQRDLLACKNIIKNALHGTVGIIIRFNQMKQNLGTRLKKLQAYTSKVSPNFPIYAQKLSKHSIVVMSKDNILKALVKKQKFREYLELKASNQIGLYFIRLYKTYSAKKAVIQQICNDKGYDFTNYGGGSYNFFKKIFLEEHQKTNIQEVLQILGLALQKLQETRQKFQVPSVWVQRPQRKQVQIEVVEGQFYSTGQILEHDQLSDMFRRSVLKQKLKMSKPSLIEYKTFSGQQQSKVIYWFIDQNNNKNEVNAQDMKIGKQYYEGKVKISNEGAKVQKIYYFDNKITFL